MRAISRLGFRPAFHNLKNQTARHGYPRMGQPQYYDRAVDHMGNYQTRVKFYHDGQFKLEKRISDRFLEYQSLRNAGAYRSAITRLGEIHQCLIKLNESERAKWTQLIEQEPISDELIQATQEAMEEDVHRIRRILSHGTRWNAEEIALVLTLRIELELALSFLNEHLHAQVTVHTEDIDDRMDAIAKTSEHHRLFASSRDLIVKNWGLPINSKWLQTAGT